MTPAPNDPLHHTHAQQSQWFLDRQLDRMSRMPPNGYRSALYTTDEFIAHGRQQRNIGYNSGVWDMLRIVGVMLFGGGVIALVVFLRS